MIFEFRKRLTLLLISVIAAVVLCTSGAALIVSEHQLSLGEQVRFDAQVDQIYRDVSTNQIMQNSQLAKFEVANDLVISIIRDDEPVAFRGGWQPLTDRSTLISRAMASSAGATERWDGSVTGNHGERYLAAVRRTSRYLSAHTVVILEDMRIEDDQRLTQRLIYAGIALLALSVLSLFSWFFTGRSMRPIRDSYEQQNQFVAAASHELRTPLQMIRSSVEALKLNPPDTEFLFVQITNELSRMGKLTEDMLILTAAPNWETVNGDPVEVDALIRVAMDNHRVVAMQKGIELSFTNLPAPLPLLEGNELMLQRALHVLIDNAVCYTPSGGHVTVTATLQTRTLEIAVQDDGPGIDVVHRTHIFERFYRADKSRTDRTHSGLGLSIARQIIVNHGGQLVYMPIKPHGSRFCMILPLISNAQVSNGDHCQEFQ
ncbi:MAG: HAMP domain-containing sensor histidine kinase [Clostridia bacterium]